MGDLIEMDITEAFIFSWLFLGLGPYQIKIKSRKAVVPLHVKCITPENNLFDRLKMDSKNQALVNLIALCALRDESALRELYEKVSPYLNSVALRVMKTDDLASDVLQESFIQIWTNAGSYRPHLAKPLTWMTSIVRYRAYDRLAKENRYTDRFKGEQDDYIDSRALSMDAGPEEIASAQQAGGAIFICLGELNDSVQQAVKLAYLEGFSREEIAVKMGTNVNTVKSWLRRGAERLKKCLQAVPEGDI